MAHPHTHPHIQSPGNSKSPLSWGRAFAVGIALNVGFVVVEVVYGIAAHSSALLADAGHNAGDVLSLVFAWTAIWIAGRKPSGKYTYGLRRTTILASMLNGGLLLVAVSFIAWDAIRKIGTPVEVAGSTMMIVAGIGVVINTITALLFMKGQKDDLNIRGAFLHMAADAAVSLDLISDTLDLAPELMQEADNEEIVTLSGLLQWKLGRVPRAGDRVRWNGWELRVLTASPNRPRLVQLRPLAPDEGRAR